MKTEYPFLFSFLYNWAADYILLLFVKKDLYPEIKNRTILIGASACSLSYILWEGTAGKLPPYCRIILKWFLIFSILYILFKIRSVKKIGKTISLFLCYLFLMGGAVSFFLSCIHIKTVGGRKTAWKAMAVIWFRACLKNHSCNLHASICGIFCLHSVDVARYAALIQTKSPTNCDAHLAESIFRTRSSAGVIFLWKMKKKKENATQISKTYTYEVRISRKGRKAVYKGIYDSGNLLVSQITGQGVCIIQKEQAAKLLLTKEKSEIEQIYIQFSEEKEEKKREKNGKKKQQIEQPLWRMWAKQFQTGIYVLQYSTVGKKNAKMPGVMAEEIVVLKDGEVLTRTKGMLGISQEELSETKEFFVLLPNDIFDREESSNIL